MATRRPPREEHERVRRLYEATKASVDSEKGIFRQEHKSQAFLVDHVSSCWFCRGSVQEEKSFQTQTLYRITRRRHIYAVFGFIVRTQYETTAVRIPRCGHCQRIHDRKSYTLTGSGLVVGFLFTMVLALQSGGGALLSIMLSAFAAYITGGLLGWIDYYTPWYGTKSLSHQQEFPSMRRLLDEGWKVGDEPPYKGEDVG